MSYANCDTLYYISIVMLFTLVFIVSGCQSPSRHRIKADTVALDIINEKQRHVLGNAQEFTIERPSDILRSRLLTEQHLPYSCEASLGTDRLKAPENWPEKEYTKDRVVSEMYMFLDGNRPLNLSLIQALQIGARNSSEYQSNKEEIFRAALDLELYRDEFRISSEGQIESFISSDSTGETRVEGSEQRGLLRVGKTLKNGIALSSALALDLVNLLTLGGASSLGIVADTTISIPLLRGSGKHIVLEPLTQAERDVVYAMYEFERFKRTFAVRIAEEYLSALKQQDEIINAEEHYKSLIASAGRARRLADTGRLTEIEVDQALQNELKARQRWITAISAYHDQMDSFKSLLGLPPDARIELDKSELERLVAFASGAFAKLPQKENFASLMDAPSVDALTDLPALNAENAGRFEIEESVAIQLALDNRLDLRIAQGKVYDAQRAVIVAADALGAELTLFGSAAFGERRSIQSATSHNAKLHKDKGLYTGLLSLDLPFERAEERSAYRESFITLEESVREVQTLEDQIKLAVRKKLRDLVTVRMNTQIQTKSVQVAKKRVKSVTMFIEAGRAEIRDLLDAQDALLEAQNALTSAIVNYRIAELELQSDMGVLKINEKGLWQEFIIQ
ncbi:MAG: TolC family protein [bacterium]